MLYNHTDDAVYMENENERKEYVLNETGIIFYGSSSTPRARPWDFGQVKSTPSKTRISSHAYSILKGHVAV